MGVFELEERIRSLEAETKRLSQMLRCSPDFISLVTPDGRFLYVNRLSADTRLQDVIGTPMLSFLRPQFQERTREAMRLAVETKSVQQYTTAGQLTTDRTAHFLTRVSPVVENDEVTSLIMIATEISEIEEQRVLLQVALNASGLGTWSHRVGSSRATWDDAARNILDLPLGIDAPIDEILRERVHPDDESRVATALSQAFGNGTFGPLEHRVVRPSGDLRWVRTSGLATRDSNGSAVTLVGSVQDITDNRALEARLLQAQKLESVGRLAGGVAHDFNNMLTAILANVEFAMQAGSLEEVFPMLEAIRTAADRSAGLTAQLLAFARRQIIEPRIIDPNAAVRRLDTLFQRTVGEHIRIVLSLEALGRVRVDESQFEQVVLNLITNARDAMGDGGVLTVESHDVELDEEYAARQADVSPGRYVMIAVSDTGRGIEPDALSHIFEPFYTTRQTGTGLGLATCYGIVKQSKGHIVVYSELNRGTTFKVYLPRVDGQLSTKADASIIPSAANGERILLVEDEAPVRSVVEKMLAKSGFQVVAVASAEEALRVVQLEAPFRVLITDLVLPGMDGRDLAKALLTHSPHLSVLFVSGYTENAVVQGGALDASTNFLQKPFMPADLLVAVRKVLA
jgi:two-component system, cell cycle sensor histidine kinase and response regulator CckA